MTFNAYKSLVLSLISSANISFNYKRFRIEIEIGFEFNGKAEAMVGSSARPVGPSKVVNGGERADPLSDNRTKTHRPYQWWANYELYNNQSERNSTKHMKRNVILSYNFQFRVTGVVNRSEGNPTEEKTRRTSGTTSALVHISDPKAYLNYNFMCNL